MFEKKKTGKFLIESDFMSVSNFLKGTSEKTILFPKNNEMIR